MSGYERVQFALGMAWLFCLPPMLIASFTKHPISIACQYLLAITGMFFSLWWIPRERGLPKRPTEYELGFEAGKNAANKEGIG